MRQVSYVAASAEHMAGQFDDGIENDQDRGPTGMKPNTRLPNRVEDGEHQHHP
jgi:hypothetical protein